MEKIELLKKLYFNPSGYQSKQNLYKEAKLRDPTITTKFVNEWYDIFNEKTRYYKKNSFVAPHANYEYQIDLFFITDLENQKYKIGMACIDIFTKYAVVVPIRSKQIPDFLAGLMECLTKMKKKPTFIYSDEEGALTSNDVQGYLKKEKIDVVLVYKIDRLTRSPKDFYQLIEFFEQAKIDFISITERFPTTNPL